MARSELVLKCQPRKLSEGRVVCPAGFDQDTHRGRPPRFLNGHYAFRLFVESDGRCGVKCDGIPHNLRLLRRDSAILQKRARRIGPVYLEAIRRRVAVGQTQDRAERRIRPIAQGPVQV